MSVLHKKICLYHNGKQVELHILPFISGKKKIELESIIPKYYRIEEEQMRNDIAQINNVVSDQESLLEKLKSDGLIDANAEIDTDATDTPSSPPQEGAGGGSSTSPVDSGDTALRNRRTNINYKLYGDVLNDKTQLKDAMIVKAQIDVHKDAICIDYIKAMIDYEKVKDEDLKACLLSDNNSDFWLDQNIIYIREIGDSFRRIIN